MMELKEKAGIYAEKNVISVLKEAFAQVYSAGYRDGYRDREEKIPVDLRDGKTEFVDLGLKSGTLWSKDYEKEGLNLQFLPYCSANDLDIPTVKQWEELRKECRWVYTTNNNLTSDKNLKDVLCIGPNGNSIKFNVTGFYCDKELQKNDSVNCWLRGENDLAEHEKSCGFIGREFLRSDIIGNNIYESYGTKHSVIKQFSGYKLPIRLVKEK